MDTKVTNYCVRTWESLGTRPLYVQGRAVKKKNELPQTRLKPLTTGFLGQHSIVTEVAQHVYNTHTPSHPSTADEAWYWPKHILHIG